jgi:MFS family permease
MYKTSRPEGRSVQFAGYSIFVSLVGAPMPLLGGWLVSHLASAGVAVDLRITFYVCACVIFVTALLARTLKEPESVGTRTLVFTHFPEHLVRLWGSVAAIGPVFTSLMRLQLHIGRKRSD